MKKTLIILMALLFMNACNIFEKEESITSTTETPNLINYTYSVGKYIFEEHEYLAVFWYGERGGICHSETCPCKIQYNQIIMETTECWIQLEWECPHCNEINQMECIDTNSESREICNNCTEITLVTRDNE